MIVEKILKTAHIKNELLYLMVGALVTSLLISLGMVGILALLDFPVNPALPSAFGAIGAALFAARAKMPGARGS